MKKNIRILILASILGLAAMSFIQGYLINNTYKLEKDVFIQETKDAIFRFDDNIPEMDSIYEVVGDFVVNRMIDYKLGRIKKNLLLDGFETLQDSVNERYTALYEQAFRDRNLSKPVKFQKRLKSIILLDSTKNDTLFYKPNKSETLRMLGETFDLENAYGINNSQTSTNLERDYEEDGLQKVIELDFQIVTQDYFNIDGWKKEVLKRMSGILALSILIFALVFGLLYYSIKNLITQKKIAEVKTDFINNITHELKTPLATLSLSTKMLKNDVVKSQPKVMDATADTIHRQTLRLQKLIDQVLENSLGYRDISLNAEAVVVGDYLNTVLDDFQLSVKEDQVNIFRNIKTNNETVMLDKFYFTTAIFNILENAVKYNSGKVNIDFNVNIKDGLMISISDNGIGIPTKHKAQIFDKFYRASDQEVHNVKGLGLGLYYTNQIVKAHKGEILVKDNKDKGVSFNIKIPLAK